MLSLICTGALMFFFYVFLLKMLSASSAVRVSVSYSGYNNTD